MQNTWSWVLGFFFFGLGNSLSDDQFYQHEHQPPHQSQLRICEGPAAITWGEHTGAAKWSRVCATATAPGSRR